MATKFAMLVGDGMADLPIPELQGKTPLAYAYTPNMDHIAAIGTIGRIATIPKGLPPGSDVGNLSLLGYDPARYYSGRAPIEAASMGVLLGPGDTAFRCNLVTITDGRMLDYSAGHIDTNDALELITLIEQKLGSASVRFHAGVSYRHLMVVHDFPAGCTCIPPHDFSGREVVSFLPSGPGSELLHSLMDNAHTVLKNANVNLLRQRIGKKAATDIWLWGHGRAVTLPIMAARYGLSGSVISAVDLVRGLGILAGLRVRLVEGATGYLRTNYTGKMAAAASALAEENFVFLHVEAPDETSHEGSLQKKITAIEEFDKNIVGEMLKLQKETSDLQIIVTPDHATPLSLRTHDSSPVPFAACGCKIRRGNAATYSEYAAKDMPVLSGTTLFDSFIKGTL
jgi:2,3-bisphosphoglycerate-independent phosphoglycerate mutase